MMKTHALSRTYTVIIIMAIVIAAIISYGIFRSRHPALGFTYYEPAYLPPNVTVQDKYIMDFHGDRSAWLRLAPAIYAIREDSEATGIPPAAENYDPTSIKPTCHIGKTPTKFAYRVCHWVDYGRTNVNEVQFGRGSTWIVSWIPTSLDEHLTIAQIEKFIDSFAPQSAAKLRVDYTSGP